MNSRSSSIYFLAAVIGLMVICNVLQVIPPAILADCDHKSAVSYINVPGAKSRIASRRENATQVRNTSLVCCGPPDAIVEKSVHQTCSECKKLCESTGKDVKNGSSWQIDHCRCHKGCPNIGDVRQVTSDGSDTEHTQDNYIDSSSSTRYGSFATASMYNTVFHLMSSTSCISMFVTAFVYVLGIGNNQYNTYVQHLMMSITLLTYVNKVTQFQKHPTIDDFRLSGIHKLIILFKNNGWQWANYRELFHTLNDMDRLPKPNKNKSKHLIYFNIISWIVPTANTLMTYYYYDDSFSQINTIGLDILISRQIFGLNYILKIDNIYLLIPGFIDILFFIKFFVLNKIDISSIHPDLISVYKKKILTRDILYTISILMWIIELMNYLNVLMKWDFVIFHILQLLQPCKGFCISLIYLLQLEFQGIFKKMFTSIFYLIRRNRRTEVTPDIPMPEC